MAGSATLNKTGASGERGTAGACVHHWVVETPHGAKENRGECRHCRAEKFFPASNEGTLWSNDWIAEERGRPEVLAKKENLLLSDEVL